MLRDLDIQWDEPLEDDEYLKSTANNTNDDSILCKEISSLKADNWSLKLSLADSLQCSNNLQV